MEEEDGKSLVITGPIRQGVFQSSMPCVCPTPSSRAWGGEEAGTVLAQAGGSSSTSGAPGPYRWKQQV